MLQPAHPALDCTYQMATYSSTFGAFRLRDCDGNWAQGYNMEDDGINMDPSSPSDIDGLTCSIWPFWVRDNPAAGGRDMVGTFKYFYSVKHGGYLTAGDQIRIEENNYRIFNNTPVGYFAIRTE